MQRMWIFSHIYDLSQLFAQKKKLKKIISHVLIHMYKELCVIILLHKRCTSITFWGSKRKSQRVDFLFACLFVCLLLLLLLLTLSLLPLPLLLLLFLFLLLLIDPTKMSSDTSDNCMLSKHENTAWCYENGSLTSLDACISGASSDVKGPISLHQAVLQQLLRVK